MAITCRFTIDAGSGAVALYPVLPVGEESFVIADDRRQLNGQLRRAYRSAKARYTLRLPDADETVFATWVSVAQYDVTLTVVNERGATLSMVLISWSYNLTRTTPVVEGGTNTSGAGYYDLEMVLEQI